MATDSKLDPKELKRHTEDWELFRRYTIVGTFAVVGLLVGLSLLLL